MKHSSFIRYSWFLVGMVFLVILAGGVVRMTQSGMGCPDWPKCFGMWIPPVNEAQLPADFEKYLDKQDIDHTFNVYHTWIEYINRLLGALLGLFILGNLAMAVKKYWNQKRSIVWISLALLFVVGFQGWLGKLVVDSNLSVAKITTHMLVAIIIAILPLWNIALLRESKVAITKRHFYIMAGLLVLLLIQIVLGTQVRESVDVVSKALSYEQRDLWIGRLGTEFIIHRSFSWGILVVSILLWWQSRSHVDFRTYSNRILILILANVLVGIVMAHLGMPALAQPLHLIFGTGVVVLLVYIMLITRFIDINN